MEIYTQVPDKVPGTHSGGWATGSAMTRTRATRRLRWTAVAVSVAVVRCCTQRAKAGPKIGTVRWAGHARRDSNPQPS